MVEKGIEFNYLLYPINKLPKLSYAGFHPVEDGLNKCQVNDNSNCFIYHLYSGEVEIGHVKYEIKKGSISIIPAKEKCLIYSKGKSRHWMIQFKNKLTSNEAFIKLPFSLSPNNQKSYILKNIMDVCVHYHRPSLLENNFNINIGKASLKFHESLLYLNNNSEENELNDKVNGTFDKLFLTIEDRLNKKISIPQIAQEVSISQNYLSTIFKQKFGITINQYLLKRRIERAQELLIYTELSIKDVGAESGMPDPQYFNKQFRKITGKSPSQFRTAVN